MIGLGGLIGSLERIRSRPDRQQLQVLEAAPHQPLFVVAGPGTGKTTALTLRILKVVLVDGVPPRGVVATTFTVKAAAELRSRVLGWGFAVIDALTKDGAIAGEQRAFVAGLDINQVWTGTVDGLCEQLLRDYRAAGTQPPVLADEFVSKTLMLREGLFDNKRHEDGVLGGYLEILNGSRWNFHAGTKAELLQSIWERRFQDQVDWGAFVANAPQTEARARQIVADALYAYEAALQARGMVDFSLLEDAVLRRLKGGQLEEFTRDLRVVLVDEYQDSNLLQEQLYFELAAACGGALTVVGDDDQSLYRFRGATVDLFRDFPARYRARFHKKPQTVFLTNNYRSTDEVRTLVNGYATLDRGYQGVRVAGKPVLARPSPRPGLPVLGMFRPNIDNLATDLAAFVHQVFRGKGYRLADGRRIERDPKGGDVGDCALLCSSPAEWRSGKERLPFKVRQALEALNPPIRTFNPRGEDLPSIPLVQQFGGLLLECIDPGGVVEGQTSGIAPDASTTFTEWRQAALDLASSPAAPAGLADYATGWAYREPGRKGYEWPRSVAVIGLIYGLTHYFPELHDDPEGQVYLEVFTRQLTAAEQIGSFRGRLVHDPKEPGLGDASVRELLRDFLGPIAAGVVQVNEDLLDSFPRDRLSILSIHQSKGLEFPLTIVDVGSDFKDLRSPKFKRMPEDGGPPHRLEDLLRPYSPLGVPARSQRDRAFDDLYRQYFVAFSRAQDILLLVGVNATAPGGRVPNIATGWDRLGACHWAGTAMPLFAI